jgi:hypothetical protein
MARPPTMAIQRTAFALRWKAALRPAAGMQRPVPYLRIGRTGRSPMCGCAPSGSMIR